MTKTGISVVDEEWIAQQIGEQSFTQAELEHLYPKFEELALDLLSKGVDRISVNDDLSPELRRQGTKHTNSVRPFIARMLRSRRPELKPLIEISEVSRGKNKDLKLALDYFEVVEVIVKNPAGKLARLPLDLGANHLTVRRNVWRGIEGTPKGTSSRVVPLTPELAQALQALGPSKGRVFSNAEGSYWTVTNVRAALKRQRKRAGLRKIGWHTLRHTFCSHLAMRGAPIVAIQALAGHTSVAVTQRYLHLAPESLIQAVRLLSRPVLDVSCQLVANEKEDAA